MKIHFHSSFSTHRVKMYNYSEPILPESPITQLNEIIHSTLYVYITFIALFLVIMFGGMLYLILTMNSGYTLFNCCRNSDCDCVMNTETQV